VGTRRGCKGGLFQPASEQHHCQRRSRSLGQTPVMGTDGAAFPQTAALRNPVLQKQSFFQI